MHKKLKILKKMNYKDKSSAKTFTTSAGYLLKKGINGKAEPYRMKIYKQKKRVSVFLWKLSLKKVAMTYSPTT